MHLINHMFKVSDIPGDLREEIRNIFIDHLVLAALEELEQEKKSRYPLSEARE